MTYQERVYSMTGAKLIEEAEKFGVKLNKKGNTLKESKAKAADKIIAAYEAQHAEEPKKTEEPAEVVEAVETKTAPAEEPKKEKKERKHRENTEDVKQLTEYILSKWAEIGTIKEPAKDGFKFKALCTHNGRQVIKFMWTTKKVNLFVRIDPEGIVNTYKKINYALPFQCMFTEYTGATKKQIDKLMTTVMKADAVRPKKEKKAK